MKKVILNFSGYETEKTLSSFPPSSGIYCVYRGIETDDKLKIRELLYIGESDNVRSQLTLPERKAKWEHYLQNQEILIYSFALMHFNRCLIQAALVHHHRPPENSEFHQAYPYPDTWVQLNGATRCLHRSFFVKTTEEFHPYFAWRYVY